ncbi:MAG: aminotransferase class III-fold pyridoxal phosphate-dependent enzyme [Burkholderiaceae bacterium]
MNLNDIDLLKENNARQMWHPMAHPAESQENPPKIIASAKGVRITDVDGHTTIDGVGGLWNVNLGYSCEPIKKAIAAQLETLPYYSAFRGTSTAPAIELSALVGQWFAPDGMARSFFTSGGSDSVESALRLARQYHKIRGDRDRTKFISLKRGYHGTHFGAASVNGNTNFRRNYEPLLAGCFHIATPYPYRNPFNESDPAKLAQACAAALEDEILFQGPDTVAAFIMEPVLGAGGVIPPHETFMPLVRDICTRHGILMIADEVITGFGRTGAWTGCRLSGVQPDMMCIAKAITNGYFPFGATMISGAVAEVFEQDQSAFGAVFHGYTYSAHPVGAAAALACIPELTRLNVAGNAQARGEELLAGAKALMAKHEIVGDVRGKGLMIALELVSDRQNKTPADKELTSKIGAAIYKAGVMVRISGPNLILSPPLVITAADVTEILGALDAGLAAAA